MQPSFFAIRLILKYGNIASIVIAVLAAIMANYLSWEITSWFSIPIGVLVGCLVGIICRSYVEIIYIVFHMLN